MTERITKSLETGSKVLFTDSQGREHAAAVAYIWHPGDNPHPLINLAYSKAGEATVATSVPHASAVKGASGFYYKRPAGKTHRVNIHAEPGDLVEITNLANDWVQCYRVAEPK